MTDTLAQTLAYGLTGSPTWLLIASFAIVAQLTILSVTLYLHRSQAHRAVDFHPLLAHGFRFWCWLTTAMVTREWVAIHRKHHARCETSEDPHSPVVHGMAKVAVHGVTLYQQACRDRALIAHYGQGCPDDLVERWVYARMPAAGPTLLLLVALAAFGALGLTWWALLMLVIPVCAAGVINGLGHGLGYRNFETADRATNLVPWALLLGGEELHNNHHAFPSSARFAQRWFELDLGWGVLRVLAALRLARIRRVAPRIALRPWVELPDAETLKALLTHRGSALRDYFREVILPALREEADHAGVRMGRLSRRLRHALANDGRWLDAAQRERLGQWVAQRPSLQAVCDYRRRLAAVLDRAGKRSDEMLEALQQWCREAEASGIHALENYARRVRGLALQPVTVGR